MHVEINPVNARGGYRMKKEKIHYVRDNEGKIICIIRNGFYVNLSTLKMKTSQQLLDEYYKKHEGIV